MYDDVGFGFFSQCFRSKYVERMGVGRVGWMLREFGYTGVYAMKYPERLLMAEEKMKKGRGEWGGGKGRFMTLTTPLRK